ncbi:MAG: polysaccharide deacetylase family protein [Acutalibacteraceae bacterium]|nr:polysaccharide deacetylase family protein [Acutalibacteraceae bacterium]
MKYRYIRFPGGIGKAVTFSYDDGNKLDIRLAEIFDKYGVKGTFNVCGGLIGNPGKLSAEEMQKHFIDKGHEIACHGFEHTAPGMLRPFEGVQEYINDRKALESALGMIIRGLAYPNSGINYLGNGATYDNIRSYLSDLGFMYGRSLAGDNNGFKLPHDWFNWIPTMHHGNPNALTWAQEFADITLDKPYFPANAPRLFYVWGHSFEFENNNNWEHIENILKIVANREDIWYATNIEIREYVEAYDRLVFTADSKTVYNPTLIDVWFEQPNGLFCIKSGETVTLE